MTKQLHLTDLQEDEKIIFGPVKQVQQSSLGVKSEDDPKTITHRSLRIVCVTNQRIIIENGDSHIHYPVKDIRRVLINRRKNKKNNISYININKALTSRGNMIKLDIPDIKGIDEVLVNKTFPNAVIEEEKGLVKFLGKLLGS